MSDLWPIVPALLDEHRYMTLGTADADGRPWVSPVFYASRGTHELLWVSAPTSRHSQNISERPEIAITIFDSHGEIGNGDALYMWATAGRRSKTDLEPGLVALNARLSSHRRLTAADIGDELALYGATVREHSVLIRGNDPRFENSVDTRLVVTPADNAHIPSSTGGRS